MREHAQAPEQSDVQPDVQRELEDLRAQITVNRSDIDDLLDGSEESSARADAIEGRADEDRERIDGLAVRADLDHELIKELQSEGVIRDELTAHLQVALRSSRRIGAAIGIVMLACKVSEEAAFELLRTASQNANRKLRLVAEEIVQTGDISLLPLEPPALSVQAQAVPQLRQ